jgi:hypothetical protein
MANEPPSVPAMEEAPRPAERSSLRSVSAFGCAFACFGLALGTLTGLSMASGISQALLTSILTFVAGALLSYVGFQRVGSDGQARLDPFRVAASVTGLSLGMLLGLPTGLYGRCNVRAQSFFVGEALRHSSCAPAIGSETTTSAATGGGIGRPLGLGLQAKPENQCDSAIVELNIAARDPQRSSAALGKRITELLDACQLTQP